MSADENQQQHDQHFAMLLVSLLVVVALFLLGAYTLFQHGGKFVTAQDDTVGEMLLDEGLRRLAGGAEKEARIYLRLAESARFEGTKNRRHLQKIWGDLMLADGDAQAAGAYYAEAAQDWNLHEKDPALLADAYAMHAEMLHAAGSTEALREWLKATPAGAAPDAGAERIMRCQRYYAILCGTLTEFDLAGDWSDAAWADALASDDPDQAEALSRLGLLAPVSPVRERAAAQLRRAGSAAS